MGGKGAERDAHSAAAALADILLNASRYLRNVLFLCAEKAQAGQLIARYMRMIAWITRSANTKRGNTCKCNYDEHPLA